MPYERADDPELRAVLGGPDPRLFELAGVCARRQLGGGAIAGRYTDRDCRRHAAYASTRLQAWAAPPSPTLAPLVPTAANDAAGLKRLVLSGAVPSVRALDPDGRHALNIAVFENKGTDVVQLLLDIDPGWPLARAAWATR